MGTINIEVKMIKRKTLKIELDEVAVTTLKDALWIYSGRRNTLENYSKFEMDCFKYADALYGIIDMAEGESDGNN